MVDLGQTVLKLWDEVIAQTKNDMITAKNNFIREIPRRMGARTSVSAYQAESYIQELADQLVQITQELLNEHAVTTAKKIRALNRENNKNLNNRVAELEGLLKKKELEIEGLKAKAENSENRALMNEKEKDEALERVSKLTELIEQLEQRLHTIEQEYQQEIERLNAEWSEHLRKKEEEIESIKSLSKLKEAIDQKKGQE